MTSVMFFTNVIQSRANAGLTSKTSDQGAARPSHLSIRQHPQRQGKTQRQNLSLQMPGFKAVRIKVARHCGQHWSLHIVQWTERKTIRESKAKRRPLNYRCQRGPPGIRWFGRPRIKAVGSTHDQGCQNQRNFCPIDIAQTASPVQKNALAMVPNM